MRRITLALALVSAVAAAGCSGGAISTDDGGNRGVAENTFKVTVQNGQGGNAVLALTGGYVTSTPPGIDCGAGRPGPCEFSFTASATAADGTVTMNSVTLTATAIAPNIFYGFAGDCAGATCVLSGYSDKYVVAQMTTPDRATGHPNWSHPDVHAPMAASPSTYQCYTCHGATGQGAGIAPACSSCHNGAVAGGAVSAWPLTAVNRDVSPVADDVVGDHFRMTAAFDDHTTGWSQACQRCHTHQGFQDYIGFLAYGAETTTGATDNHLGTTFRSTNTKTTCITSTSTIGADGRPVCTDPTLYAFGPFRCTTCHNAKSEPLANSGAGTLTTVRFPSTGSFAALPAVSTGYPNTTATVNPLALVTTNNVDGSTGICAQCHQGRESTASVNARIASSATGYDLDAVIGTGTFINPHYLGAAGTLFGTAQKMWAEYPGKIYSGKFEHAGKTSCTFCHDAHTGHLPADIRTACGSCHLNEAGAAVADYVELEESRQFGYMGDVDGDGIEESLKHEIEGLEVVLYAKIKAYAVAKAGTAICYNGAAHPYYFKDNNGAADGVCDATESVSANGYNSFTPRLLRAAFNYKWAHAEPGAWAHNARYAIEILFDGIVDLRQGLGETVTLANTAQKRSFEGHFGGSTAAAPYRAMVYSAFPATSGFSSKDCYQCHGGATGLAEYPANATYVVAPGTPSDAATTSFSMKKVTGFECSTCHTIGGSDMRGIRTTANLYFPGQKPAEQQTVVAPSYFPKAADAVCATCHSGREGTLSIDAYVATLGGEAAGWVGGFKNPHYLGAAGVLLGSNAKMMYQFPGKTYTANPAHYGSPHGSLHGSSCTGCHEPKGTAHSFEITAADMAADDPATLVVEPSGKCGVCHRKVSYGDFRLSLIEHEFVTLKNQLKLAIAAYSDKAVTNLVPGANRVCYKESYPYFTIDSVAPYGFDCTTGDTGTPKMDPAMVRATGNYKWAAAEPGAWAHNTEYALEILYDSIKALGATPSIGVPGDATRPAPTVP